MTSLPSPEERAALLHDLEGLRPEISVPVLTVAEIVALLEAVDRLDALEQAATQVVVAVDYVEHRTRRHAPYDESVEPITGCSGRYNCTAATHIEGCLHNVIPPGEPDETPEGDPLGVTLGFDDVGTRSAAEHEALAAGAGVSEPTEGPR